MKGIPKKFEDKDLRELFAFAGEVTDAKVIRNRNGQSRQFAFVGFVNDADATRAQKRINGTYVRTSRVQVEIARPTGDPNLSRPWSRHSKGSSAYAKRIEREERADAERFRAETRARSKEVAALKEAERKAQRLAAESSIAEKDREVFRAFKDAVQKSRKKPVWADGNEAPLDGTVKYKKSVEKQVQTSNDSDSSSSDDEDEYQELPGNEKRKVERKVDIEEEATVDSVAMDDGISDADYFKSKISKAVEISDESESSSDEDSNCSSDDEEQKETLERAEDNEGLVDKENISEENRKEADSEKPQNQRDPSNRTVKYGTTAEEEVDAAETGRLFVRNLAYTVSEEDLERLFEKFGTLAEVHIVTDSVTKRSRGVALVLFVIPENAAKAMAALDGTIFCGRLLHILPGRPRPPSRNSRSVALDAAGMNTFKREREEARAEAARSGADQHAQNTMFLGSDAVANTVASRLGVSKSELYGTQRGESGAAAVRLAVAEASVQAETRQFLLENGVDLRKAEASSTAMSANTKAAKRSRSSRISFLVKNLPAGTKESHLDELFTKFGSLTRLALAPSALLAVVEYATAGEAKRAYGGLAYRRFRDVPLYLEWLPAEAIVNAGSAAGSSARKQAMEDEQDAHVNAGSQGTETEEQLVNSSSVYVKNLNFDTKEESLKAHFRQTLRRRSDVLKGLRSVTVATKRSVKDGVETRLSMGFGFAEFASYSLAAEAVKIAQGTVLDGHTLELRLSNRIVDSSGASKKRQRNNAEKRKPNAKLIVRNVAFEANVREVRELFASFGQIKSVRLPRKMDGSHRGFGFLEFVSTNEAKNAKEALTDSHLYGRHLVIEYADEEATGAASIEKLVENAARQVSKRRRIDAVEEPSNDVDDEEEKMRDALYT